MNGFQVAHARVLAAAQAYEAGKAAEALHLMNEALHSMTGWKDMEIGAPDGLGAVFKNIKRGKDPVHETLLFYGYYLCSNGEFGAAAGVGQVAASSWPLTPRTSKLLAASFANLGHFDEAERYLAQCFAPDQAAVRSVLSSDAPIFLHIPKTGGTSVTAASAATTIAHRFIKDGDFDASEYRFHATAGIEASAVAGRFIFTNVRNIFALLVSFYFEAQRIIYASHQAERTFVARRTNFSNFLKFLAHTEKGWISNRLAHWPIFAQPSGRLAVDWINRLEMLDEDLDALARKHGLRFAKPDVLNRSVRKDYRTFYSDADVALVQRVWARDIELFGFDFERGYTDNARLHRDVAGQKEAVSYRHQEDRLDLKKKIS